MLAVLLAVEVLADKVAGVDSINDVIQTVVRPAAGAVLFAGSIGLLTDLPPWVGVVAGLLVAGGVHATKAAVRPAVTVSTGGLGNPVVSAIEDAVSLVVSVLAILAPVLMAVLLVIGGAAVALVAARRVPATPAPPSPPPDRRQFSVLPKRAGSRQYVSRDAGRGYGRRISRGRGPRRRRPGSCRCSRARW